jgi:hypothetical protein
VAAVFRALATMEGTLARLAPGFNVVLESRAFAAERIAGTFEPASLRQTATQELVAMLPVLRRLPRRVDRISGALEQGRLSVNVRLLADERDRRVLTGMLHQVLLAFIGATTGIMAVVLLGTTGGPRFLGEITLYQILGWNLLVVSAMLGLRLLSRFSGRSALLVWTADGRRSGQHPTAAGPRRRAARGRFVVPPRTRPGGRRPWRRALHSDRRAAGRRPDRRGRGARRVAPDPAGRRCAATGEHGAANSRSDLGPVHPAADLEPHDVRSRNGSADRTGPASTVHVGRDIGHRGVRADPVRPV